MWANERPENGLDGGANKGMEFSPRNKATCPYCLKEGAEANLKPYHFEN